MSSPNRYYCACERRKFPRASARVIYAVLDSDYLGNEIYTKDISADGMCFLAREKVDHDSLLALRISFPQGDTVDLKAKVLRQEEIRVVWTPKEQYKIAVQFINTPDTHQEKITNYVEKSHSNISSQ